MNNKIKPVSASSAGKRKRGRRVLLLLAILLLLALAVWLLFPRLVHTDRVVRFFRYMGLRDKEGYGTLRYENGAGSVCAGFDDGLLVGTESGLTLYGLDGEQRAFIQGSVPSPVLRTGGELGLLFSPGSSYVAAVGAGGETLLDGPVSGTLLNADVSFDGCMACITAESGYKAVVTVYDAELEAIYRYSSRTRYLNACAVSEKAGLLAVSALEEQESVYRSVVLLLRTDEDVADLAQEQSAKLELDLGNRVVYALHFLDRSHLLAVTQDELIFFNTAGEQLEALSLEEGELIDYSISPKGWLVAALNENGGGSRVLTLNASGRTLAEQQLADRVHSVSAAGDCAAVLTELYLQIYDSRLEALDRSWDILSATRVVARADGTALLLSAGGAKLYIP